MRNLIERLIRRRQQNERIALVLAIMKKDAALYARIGEKDLARYIRELAALIEEIV